MPSFCLRRELDMIDEWRRSFEKAMEAGVLRGIGVDIGAPYMIHGKNAEELEIYVRYGVSEMAAIEVATRVNAEILGLEDRIGAVEAGKEAGLMVVKKDLLEDIEVLQEMNNIALVIKGGEIIMDRRVNGTSGWGYPLAKGPRGG